MIMTLSPEESAIYITPKEYFAALGSRFTDRDAQVIGPELERLSREGRSSAADIVETARPTHATLHRFFEWNDQTAAELYRHDQARHMGAQIVVKVTVGGEEVPVRAFSAVKLKDSGESDGKPAARHYVTIQQIAEDRDLSEQVMDEALMYLRTWEGKYRAYSAILPGFETRFGPVFSAIETAKDR